MQSNIQAENNLNIKQKPQEMMIIDTSGNGSEN